MNRRSFAHPVERALADVFDANGIAWRYEPVTFVLDRAPDGSVSEALTPDFYLPGLDIYIECTVMRQRYTTRKRRKIRRAAARYEVTIELLCRSEVLALARRHRLDALLRAASEHPALAHG